MLPQEENQGQEAVKTLEQFQRYFIEEHNEFSQTTTAYDGTFRDQFFRAAFNFYTKAFIQIKNRLPWDETDGLIL